MTERSEPVRFALTGELVCRFRCAIKLEAAHQPRGIDCAHPPTLQVTERFADESRLVQSLWQGSTGGCEVSHGADVEMVRPVSARQVGRLMPVIRGTVEQEQRFA